MWLNLPIILLFLSHSLNIFVVRSDEIAADCITTRSCSADPNVELFVDKRNRTHPSVRFLNSPCTAMGAKFRSLSGRSIDVYWDDGGEGVEQAHLRPGQESTTNTYEGHTFFATPAGDKSKVLARFTVNKNQVFYPIEDPEFPAPKHVIEQSLKETAFVAEYLERTGYAWRHYYGPEGPRPPPILYMWPANEIGDVHRVRSNQSFWTCFDGDRDNCQSKEPLTFELEVISIQPRAFIIEDFISHQEADEIIRLASPTVHLSSVGNRDGGGTRTSNTRTSYNTWMQRTSAPFLDTLYRRAADLLRIDESLLHSHKNAEDIQVVHYVNGQKYDSHHDWGVSGYPESRFLTLLLYLTDQPDPLAGGETSLPKGNNGRGMKITPKKGQAMLFYDLLEDGNGDDLSLHAALPTITGEKWLANFWVWDPKRKN